MRRPILDTVLQDLCPRCGSDRLGVDGACGECGFDPGVLRREAVSPGITLGPLGLAVLALATVGVAIIALGVGLRLAPDRPDPEVVLAPTATPRVSPPAEVGRVLFAERLDEGLALVGYRTEFTRTDTIAWRAELSEPASSTDLTMVIAWTSIRETMQLSRSTVTIRDPELSVIGRDEVLVDDLVPTAGLYSVAYYDGDTKLAEGTFELLPPER